MSMKLIELGGFDTVPAIRKGNLREDNIANAKLYQRLLKNVENTGIYPVFVKKNYGFDYFWLRLSDRGVKDRETYQKAVSRMLEDVNWKCFEVWRGRMLYDYKLDCCVSTRDYEEYMEDLIPPVSDEYKEKLGNYGYYFVVAAGNKPFESVKFYNALSEAGYPVIVSGGCELERN